MPYCTIITGHPRDKRMISLAMVDYQEFAIAPEGPGEHNPSVMGSDDLCRSCRATSSTRRASGWASSAGIMADSSIDVPPT